MNKDFLDDINSDDFQEDEDDKVIELFKDLVRRFHEYDTDYIVNPKVYPKILKMMKIIAEAVLEEADDAKFEWEFDPLIGTKICFEITTKEEFGIYDTTLKAIRELDDGIIESIAISPKLDGSYGVGFVFRNARIARLHKE